MQAALPCGGVKPYFGSWLTVPHPVSKKSGIQMSQLVRSTALREVDFKTALIPGLWGRSAQVFRVCVAPRVGCSNHCWRICRPPAFTLRRPGCAKPSMPLDVTPSHMLRQFALARGAVGAGGAQPRMRSQGAADIGRRQPSLYVRVLTHGMFGPQPYGVRDHLVCSTRLLTSSADLVGSSRQLISSAHLVCAYSLLSSARLLSTSAHLICSARLFIPSAELV